MKNKEKEKIKKIEKDIDTLKASIFDSTGKIYDLIKEIEVLKYEINK